MVERVVTIKVDVKGEKQLDDLDKKQDKVAKSAKSVVAGMAKLAAGVAAAGTALAFAIKQAADSRRELEILARQAGKTVGEFEALAFATKQYGIEAEQIADISKDVQDRIGEFATVGTGAFQDFLDVVGLTKEEGIALAQSFDGLAGDEIILEVVRQLEAANATGAQTTFVLESLGSDLSRLTPLFADNGAELSKLTGAYTELNGSLALTEDEAKGLQEAAIAFDSFTTTLGKASTKILATIAAPFAEFLNEITKVLPDATAAVADFINQFKDADEISDTAALIRQIESLKQSIARGEQGLADGIFTNTERVNENLEANRERLKLLQDQLAVLQAQDAVEAQSSGASTAQSDPSLTTEQKDFAEATKKQLDRELEDLIFYEQRKAEVRAGAISEAEAAFLIARSNEESLLDQRQEAALAKLGENEQAKLELVQEFDRLRVKQAEIAGQEIAEIRRVEQQQALIGGIKTANNWIQGLAQLNEKSKGLKRAAIVSSTAVAVMETFKNAGGWPWGVIPAGIMAAVGAKQFAQVGKTNFSGGGISGGSAAAANTSASAGLGSQSVSTATQVNRIESTALEQLNRELAERDPDEVLPVSYVRRITASIDVARSEGAI